MPDGTITAVLQGIRRFKVIELISTVPYHIATIKELRDIIPDKQNRDIIALEGSIKDTARTLIKQSNNFPQEAEFAIRNIDSFEFLVNFIGMNLDREYLKEKVEMIKKDDVAI